MVVVLDIPNITDVTNQSRSCRIVTTILIQISDMMLMTMWEWIVLHVSTIHVDIILYNYISEEGTHEYQTELNVVTDSTYCVCFTNEMYFYVEQNPSAQAPFVFIIYKFVTVLYMH